MIALIFFSRITVGTNYVPISLVQGAALYVYNICQEPHLNDKKLVSFILHKHEDDLGQIFICNGGNVISPTPFRSKVCIFDKKTQPAAITLTNNLI